MHLCIHVGFIMRTTSKHHLLFLWSLDCPTKTFLIIYPIRLEDKSPCGLGFQTLTKEGSKDLRFRQQPALSHILLGCRSTQGELSEMSDSLQDSLGTCQPGWGMADEEQVV